MTLSVRNLTFGLCLTIWLLAVPSLGYAAYVAVETAAYIPFPGEDMSRLNTAYLFSALLGGVAVVAMALAVVAWRRARRATSRRASTAITATGLVVAVLAFGLVGVTTLS
jgi:hypothetical protein